VIVWATSNRLNLTRGSRSEREDEVNAEEAVAEKSALAARFGRRIRFPKQDRAAYLAICHRLVRDRLGEVPAGLDEAALRFAVQGHGFSARTAVQFAASRAG
jgi:predicted AAA+ superfamily ATPase